MASSYSETIIALLDELRSAAVSQGNAIAQQEDTIKGLRADKEGLTSRVAELERQLSIAQRQLVSLDKSRSLERNPLRGSISKQGHLHSATRPLAMSQTVAEYERRHPGPISREQNVARSYSDSQVAGQKAVGQGRTATNNLPSNIPPPLPSPSGSSTSIEGEMPHEFPERRQERRASFSRSLDDSVAQRPSGSSSFMKPTARSTRVSQQNGEAQAGKWTEYTLSPDMEQKVSERIVSEICRKYSGPLRTQRAARVIQQSYREYRLRQRVQHLRDVRQSRLLTTQSMTDMMEAVSRGNHLVATRTESFHRPLQRVNDNRQVDPRSQTVSPALSLTSTMSESNDSIVGITEMVVMPELMRVPMEASMASDISSEASSVSASPIPDESLRRVRIESGRATPTSITSSPGMSHSGTPFEVVRRASFSVKVADSKIRRQRHLRIGITHFNRKPTKGVRYLINKGLLIDDAKSVAIFLKRQGGLSRGMIGDYLGTLRNAFCMAALQEFVDLFNMEGMTFVHSLRKFLSTFRLPGEAQQIDIILQRWAERFSKCNPAGATGSTEMAHILAFSTIMLNTDLHNKNVKRHMTQDDFIRNNRGLNDGEDLPQVLLENIYEEVLHHEFKTAKDHVQQVLSLEKSISGPCPRLAQPHRQLVHVARMFEVVDKDKKQAPNAHSRFLFLFNDMLLVAKYASRKASWSYIFKSSLPLLGMKVEEFSNQFYKHGVQVKTNFEGKVMATFNGEKEETKKNFVRDLKEVMAEIIEMEEERIQEMEQMSTVRATSSLSPEVGRRNKTMQPGSYSQSMTTRQSTLDPSLVSIPEDRTDPQAAMSNGRKSPTLSVKVLSKSIGGDGSMLRLHEEDSASTRSRSPTPSEQSETSREQRNWFKLGKKKKP